MELIQYFVGITFFCILLYINTKSGEKVDSAKNVKMYFIISLAITFLFFFQMKFEHDDSYFSNFFHSYLISFFLVLIGLVVFQILVYLGLLNKHIIYFFFTYILLVSIVYIFSILILGQLFGYLE